MDILDYRLIRAVAAYHRGALQSTESDVEPGGLSEADLNSMDAQLRWNQIITAYLDEQISLGRAATLLNLSRYELDERFRRLELPRRIGAETVADAQAEVITALGNSNG